MNQFNQFSDTNAPTANGLSLFDFATNETTKDLYNTMPATQMVLEAWADEMAEIHAFLNVVASVSFNETMRKISDIFPFIHLPVKDINTLTASQIREPFEVRTAGIIRREFGHTKDNLQIRLSKYIVKIINYNVYHVLSADELFDKLYQDMRLQGDTLRTQITKACLNEDKRHLHRLKDILTPINPKAVHIFDHWIDAVQKAILHDLKP